MSIPTSSPREITKSSSDWGQLLLALFCFISSAPGHFKEVHVMVHLSYGGHQEQHRPAVVPQQPSHSGHAMS
jgi:hypothetical protein